MGQYKSRPTTGSVQELWRDECKRMYRLMLDQTTAVHQQHNKPQQRQSRTRVSFTDWKDTARNLDANPSNPAMHQRALPTADGAVHANGAALNDDNDNDTTDDGMEDADNWNELHLVAFGDEVDAQWTVQDADALWRGHVTTVNEGARVTGLTPLHVCSTRSSSSHAAFARELLRRGADPGTQCKRG